MSSKYVQKNSRKFVRLKQLDCFDKVLTMIRNGYPFSRIADTIQKEEGEYNDVKKKSLVKVLSSFVEEEFQHYEKRLDDGKDVDPDDLPVSTGDNQWEIKKNEESVDVIGEYGRLYELQMNRVKMGIKKEEESDTLSKRVGKEIRIAADILKDLGEFQQDVGDMERRPHELSMNFQDPFAEETAGDPSRRSRIIGTLDAFEQLDGDVIDMLDDEQEVEDAEYEEVEE